MEQNRKRIQSRAGNETVSSRKKARRDETRPSRSRLVSWLHLARPSRIKFSVSKKKIDQNINIWVKILGEILRLMYLVSHLVSSRKFWSRDKLNETVSCLVSSRDLPSRSRLVSWLSSRYRPYYICCCWCTVQMVRVPSIAESKLVFLNWWLLSDTPLLPAKKIANWHTSPPQKKNPIHLVFTLQGWIRCSLIIFLSLINWMNEPV